MIRSRSQRSMAPLAAFACAGAMLVAGEPSWAQAPTPQEPPLLLPDAVRAALDRFPTVGAARADRDARRAAVGEARGALWPQVRLQGGATLYEEPMLVTPIHAFNPSLLPPFDTTIFNGTLGAHWTLFDGGGRGARIRSAREQESAATARLSATEQALAFEVVRRYLAVLTSRAILEAADQRLDALTAETSRTRSLRRTGRAADVEVLRAEASLAASEAERVRWAAALEVAERDLARIVGRPVEATRAAQLRPIALRDSVLAERDSLQARARAANPDIAAAEARVGAAHAGRDLAASALWPELRAIGAYNGWADDEGHDSLEWNTGLALSWSLFTGGTTRSAVERTSAEERTASESLRLAEIDVGEALDEALARLDQARSRIRSLTTAVARGSEVVRIERLSLQAGAGTQTDYLRAEADLQDARANLAEARHSEVTARADIARLVGELDENWIATTLEVGP